jgi:hypothetical protein
MMSIAARLVSGSSRSSWITRWNWPHPSTLSGANSRGLYAVPVSRTPSSQRRDSDGA